MRGIGERATPTPLIFSRLPRSPSPSPITPATQASGFYASLVLSNLPGAPITRRKHAYHEPVVNCYIFLISGTALCKPEISQGYFTVLTLLPAVRRIDKLILNDSIESSIHDEARATPMSQINDIVIG